MIGIDTYTLILFQSGYSNTIDVYTFSKFDKAQYAMDLIAKRLRDRLEQKQEVTMIINRDSCEIHNAANPHVKYIKLQIVYTNSDPSDKQILKDLKPLY